MRNTLLAAAVLALPPATTRGEDPPLPPVVFQAQPAGMVLDQFRDAARVVGGEKGVKAFNMGLREIFGEKGLDGLDINRPIVGYVVLAPKPQDITAVVAFPVTGEKEFLAFCDRVNRDKLKADDKDKTLYHLPPLDPRYKALLRFSEGYAYIAYGFNPAPHAEAKALVPMPKLFDPADRGLVSARVYFDRIPLAVKLAAPALFEEVKKTVFPGFGFGRQEAEVLKPVMAELDKLAARYAKLAAGADVLSARIYFDQQEANFVAEAALVPKPDSELAKMIAAYKTAPNRFASLTKHPDTAAAFATRIPLFAPEIRAGAAASLEAAGKQAVARSTPPEKAWTDELFKGLTRTAKNKDADLVVAFRGPDKDGWFTLVGAAAFDDPRAFGKEARASWEKTVPKEQQDRMKWDADKAGDVPIHTYHFETGGFVDFTKVLGGEKCFAAFAFAPDGLVGVIGPDPVPVLKEVLAAKPADAPAMEMVANPARVAKAFDRGARPNDPDAARIADLLGREDKLLPTMKITVEGGKELRAAYTMSLKQLPRLMLTESIERATREVGGMPQPFEKK
jgi:hypothetical protein